MPCQKDVDPGKPFSSVFLKNQEERLTQVVRFWDFVASLIFSF
jgi:hypothetical protein